MTERDYRKIFKETHRGLVGFVTNILGSDIYSEDIVADCFVQLWENGIPEGYTARGFLYGTAQMKCRSLHQAHSKVKKDCHRMRATTNNGKKTYLPASHLPPGYSRDVNRNLESEEWADGLIIRSELVALIAKQMEKMPEARRKIFDYIFIQKLDYDEIVSITGLSINIIRIQKHRIVKAFKKEFELDINKPAYWYYHNNGFAQLAKEVNARNVAARKLSPQ